MIGESLEDFLDAVYTLAGEDWADSEAVAEKIGVKVSSVYVSAGKLINIGLIQGKDRVKQVKLTKVGFDVARGIRKKHDTIKTFLSDFLCVPADVAEEDAHHIEHVISDESMEKMITFLEFIETSPDEYKPWFDKFHSRVCSLKR